GEINSTGNIDSYSKAGRGGNIKVNAPERVTLGDVSSYGMEKSGDLIIRSRAAQVNTGNVKTEAPEGNSGSIVINGTEVGTEDLSSIGTTSAGEIKVEATGGSIRIYDIENISEGTIGGLRLKAPEDITTGDQTAITVEGDAIIDNDAGGDLTTGDQTAITVEGDAIIDNDAGGDLTTGDQTAITVEGDAIIDNDAGDDLTTGDQTAITVEGDAIIDNDAGDNLTTGKKTVITENITTQVIKILEENRNNQYSNYFGKDFSEQLLNKKTPREILTDMASQTGKESAVVYINAYPEGLQIILYTKDGQPIIKILPEANLRKIEKTVSRFREQITDINNSASRYLPAAKKLYNWLLAPISEELEAANIETLLFSMSEGLRALPIAALHDGEQFLIEKYSLSLIPSISLMDINYRQLQGAKVLAMGASEFIEQRALPAVPVELEIITQKLWEGSK
ncbi:MAG: CHAT domain-containing protein, partial [Trichodesmium sp. St18_bin1]|nr:CHAT domain-containing protein [Trichodesmium sp. St18_bin1]